MPILANLSADVVNVPEFGLVVPASGSVEVDDTVAAAFADHPLLRVEPDPSPAETPPAEPAPPADTAGIDTAPVAAASTEEGSP